MVDVIFMTTKFFDLGKVNLERNASRLLFLRHDSLLLLMTVIKNRPVDGTDY